MVDMVGAGLQKTALPERSRARVDRASWTVVINRRIEVGNSRTPPSIFQQRPSACREGREATRPPLTPQP